MTWDDDCPRCADGDEPCECGEQHSCPGTWEQCKAMRMDLSHWPARLGGCDAARASRERGR